jgi:hypothetical protein
MTVRPANLYLTLLVLNLALAGVLLCHARSSRAGAVAELAGMRELVGRLRLTDLCLFTEARYTRHPAMADYHAPFQEHPVALDHFPSGSLLSPPQQLARFRAKNR